MQDRRTKGTMLAGAAMLSLALTACNKTPQGNQPVSGAPIAALELATAPPPPPTYAPAASALPPAAAPVAYRPNPEHWRYLTDAYDMSDAFADTPPDYTVDYEGEDPYVWRADDGAYRVVEWLPDGARYYYYEPGADEPFLIQDPDYSYAYNDGALVAVYTLAGALVAEQIADERRGYAARYYARGHDLYHAAVNDRRQAAYADDWRRRGPMVEAQRTRWQQGRQAEPAWRDWSAAHQAQQDQRWAPEREHRAAYAAALGAAGAAGAAYALHRHDDARRAQEAARANPQPPANAGPSPLAHGNRPDAAERHAEADRAQPGLLQGTTPPQLHGHGPDNADRHGHDAAQAAARMPTEQPGHGPLNPQQRVAARQDLAHAQIAQRQEAQQAQHAQRQQAQQAQQAQHHEAQQAAQAQHGAMQAHMQQAQMAQHAAMQAQHAQAQQQRQIHAEAHAAPAHVEAPRPQPQPQPQAQHMEASHPQPAPHPAPQPHGGGNGGGQGGDHHHH